MSEQALFLQHAYKCAGCDKEFTGFFPNDALPYELNYWISAYGSIQETRSWNFCTKECIALWLGKEVKDDQ